MFTSRGWLQGEVGGHRQYLIVKLLINFIGQGILCLSEIGQEISVTHDFVAIMKWQLEIIKWLPKIKIVSHQEEPKDKEKRKRRKYYFEKFYIIFDANVYLSLT